MTNLRYKPGYTHSFEPGIKTKDIVKSYLTAHNAVDVYNKLVNYLAIARHAECPASGWGKGHRSLFLYNGFHFPVRWMPRLEENFRRLKYDEFCAFYALEPFNERAKL